MPPYPSCLGLRVLAGERPESIVLYLPGDGVTVVDWRQPRRWGLSEGLLSPESEVRFRQPSLWEEHRGTVLAVAAVVALQTALTFGLLIQRRNRRRAEQEVRRQEERFRSVVESTPSAIVLVNAAGFIVLVNSHAEKSCGYRREELIGKRVEILVPERFRAKHPGYRAGFVASSLTRPMGADRDLYGRRKDGGEFPVEIGLTPLQTSEGLVVLSAIVDITERKRAEEVRQELAHAARLSTVGELTASIAHEINQQLGAILSNADAAEMLLESAPASLAEVRQILDEVRGYPSAGAFLLAKPGNTPGCVVLDVRMPGPSGLDLQAAFGELDDALPIIFLTGHGDIPMSVRAMKAGAVDFLTKPVQREALLTAVQNALARDGENRAARGRASAWHSRYETLTPRERAVFALVVAGKLNKHIAAELGVSERTVKAHRAQVMEKMHVTSLAELVHVAEQVQAGTPPR